MGAAPVGAGGAAAEEASPSSTASGICLIETGAMTGSGAETGTGTVERVMVVLLPTVILRASVR